MFIDYTDSQCALRDEVRALMQEIVTDELREELHHQEGGGPLYHQAMQRLGSAGWLGVGWPKVYGQSRVYLHRVPVARSRLHNPPGRISLEPDGITTPNLYPPVIVLVILSLGLGFSS